jgi:hypothetical protein
VLSNEISESGATPMWWRMLTQCPDISPSQDDVHPLVSGASDSALSVTGAPSCLLDSRIDPVRESLCGDVSQGHQDGCCGALAFAGRHLDQGP